MGWCERLATLEMTVIITVITLVLIIKMITWRSRVDHYLQFLVQTCGVAVAPIDRFWHHIFFDIMQSYSTPLTSGYHIIAISAPSRHQHHHHLGPSQELPNRVTHLWLKLRQGHSITTNPPSLSSKVKAMTPQIGVTQIRLKRESIAIIKPRVFIVVLLNYVWLLRWGHTPLALKEGS